MIQKFLYRKKICMLPKLPPHKSNSKKKDYFLFQNLPPHKSNSKKKDYWFQKTFCGCYNVNVRRSTMIINYNAILRHRMISSFCTCFGTINSRILYKK